MLHRDLGATLGYIRPYLKTGNLNFYPPSPRKPDSGYRVVSLAGDRSHLHSEQHPHLVSRRRAEHHQNLALYLSKSSTSAPSLWFTPQSSAQAAPHPKPHLSVFIHHPLSDRSNNCCPGRPLHCSIMCFLHCSLAATAFTSHFLVQICTFLSKNKLIN